MINPPRHFLSSSLYRVRESLHHDHFESSITTIISKAVAQSQTVSYGKSRLLSNQKQLEITFPDTGELFNDINILSGEMQFIIILDCHHDHLSQLCFDG